MMKRNILIIYAHPFPRQSRVSQSLRESVSGLEGIQVHELYEEYPDFLVNVAREQQCLRTADVVVFQHPFYWYNCPSLMKEWMDVVLTQGFAMGPEGTALHGKAWMHAISLGGLQAHHQTENGASFAIKDLLRPFEQSAELCGMTSLEPFVVQSPHRLGDEEIQRKADEYRDLLLAMRNGASLSPYSTRSSTAKVSP